MTLRNRLILSFGILMLIPIFGGAIGLFAHWDAARSARELYLHGELSRASVSLGRGAEVSFKTQVQEWKDVLLRGSDPEAYAKHFGGFEKNEQATNTALEELAKLAPDLSINPDVIRQARASHDEIGRRYREALQAVTRDQSGWSAVVDKSVKGVDRAFTQQLGALTKQVGERSEEIMRAENTRLERRGRMLKWIMGVGTLVGVLLGAGFGWWASHAAAQSLHEVGERLWQGAAQAASASAEVSASSQRVAEASSAQAAALEESSAALTEVNATVKQNTQHAQEAQQISQQSRVAADTSATEVAGMQQAMQAIGDASANIAKIVKSIDEIAFQTNILALNAAVEAARAGEAGAGFAVVAEEVRSLAQRSATAARETAQLIEDATTKSARGREIADRVSASIGGLIENTRKVDVLIGHIAEASREQNRGIEQATTSASRIDRLTQENAANAEETAAAAQELDSQLEQFKRELAFLRGTQTQAATSGAGQPPAATSLGGRAKLTTAGV